MERPDSKTLKGPGDEDDDQIVSTLGEIGPWQWKIILITGIFTIPISSHVLVMTFMNAEVGKWCARPSSFVNISVDVWKNISGQSQDGCSILDVDWDRLTITDDIQLTEHSQTQCEEWEYDHTVFQSTITSDFSLVCGRKYLVGLAQTLYFLGVVIGMLVFGILSDMYGRKTVMVPMLLVLGASGILSSQMPTYETYLMARVVNGSVVTAIFETYFTYVLEFVGGRWSAVMGLGVEFTWVLGLLVLSGLAWLIRDWRMLVLSFSVPSLLSLAMVWLLPESPRWLLSVGRVSEAEKIVKEGAKINNIILPENFKLAPINKTEKVEKGKKSFLHLLKNPNMRAKTLILYYNWFVSTFAFYGLALNMGQITGSGSSLHLNFSLASLIEAPAYLAALLAVLYCGRRVPYALSLFIYGLSLLSLTLIPKGVFPHDWPILVVALVSKMSITFTFGTIFLYTGELFPTEVRTSGIGSANFIGRFGGMVAPWVEVLGQQYSPLLPPVVFGVTALVAGALALLLPETRGQALPYTIEQAEKLRLRVPSWWQKDDALDQVKQ